MIINQRRQSNAFRAAIVRKFPRSLLMVGVLCYRTDGINLKSRCNLGTPSGLTTDMPIYAYIKRWRVQKSIFHVTTVVDVT